MMHGFMSILFLWNFSITIDHATINSLKNIGHINLCDACKHVNIIFNKNPQNQPVRFADFCEILASQLMKQQLIL